MNYAYLMRISSILATVLYGALTQAADDSSRVSHPFFSSEHELALHVSPDSLDQFAQYYSKKRPFVVENSQSTRSFRQELVRRHTVYAALVEQYKKTEKECKERVAGKLIAMHGITLGSVASSLWMARRASLVQAPEHRFVPLAAPLAFEAGKLLVMPTLICIGGLVVHAKIKRHFFAQWEEKELARDKIFQTQINADREAIKRLTECHNHDIQKALEHISSRDEKIKELSQELEALRKHTQAHHTIIKEAAEQQLTDLSRIRPKDDVAREALEDRKQELKDFLEKFNGVEQKERENEQIREEERQDKSFSFFRWLKKIFR